jgi:hypothetical protein
MTFTAFITALFKFLPELINLVKWLNTQVEKGVDIAKVKKTINQIDKAFEYADKIAEFDAAKAAGALNEVFTGIEKPKPVPNPKPKHKLFGKRSEL